MQIPKNFPQLPLQVSSIKLILIRSSQVKLFSKLAATFLVVSHLPLSAQQEDKKADDKVTLPKTVETTRKQIPTDKAAAEQAEFLAKNVPAAPLPAGSPKLDTLRARTLALHKHYAEYLNDVASGKKIPSAHLHELRPQHLRDLEMLQIYAGNLSREEDPAAHDVLSKTLFTALQPLGTFLEYADQGKGHVNIINKQQQDELDRLEKAWLDAQVSHATDATPITYIGPGRYYTLTNLGATLTVKAPPNSTVYFHTHGGGLFPNSLPIIEVKADENGTASTQWITYGDAFGDSEIEVRCPEAPSSGGFTTTIVKLMLRDLPEIPVNLPAEKPVLPPVQIPKK